MARYGDPGFLEAYAAAWSSGDPEPDLGQFFAADAIYVDMATPYEARGSEGIIAFRDGMIEYSPDSIVRIARASGTGRSFAAEWIWSGTALGKVELDGRFFEATGEPFAVDGCAYCEVDGEGAITLHKNYWDRLSLIRQVSAAAV